MAKIPRSVLKGPSRVPVDQYDLPVGFTPEGSMVTLRQVTATSAEASSRTLSPAQLSLDQVAALTVKRIEMQPKFEIGAIGVGTIDKSRAIAEVKARTPIGRSLMEIETRVIQDVLSLARRSHGGAA